jgi:23S rRNA (adenosine1067-2'-O)-methyltransferase
MNADYLPAVQAQENDRRVDSLLHPLAVLIRQLLTRSGRQTLTQILIDDEENIIQALEADVEIHSVCHSGGELPSVRLIRKLPEHIPVYEVARRTCKKLFENDRISRLFAIARRPPLVLESLAGISRDIVVLEGLAISGDIGAIFRTSLALDAGGIVLLNTDPVDVYDRRIVCTSRGYIFRLPVLTATTAELVHFCKQKDLPILGMAARAGTSIDTVASTSSRLVIVFGNEKNGCSQPLIDAATLRGTIPPNPKVESLNVSAAASIMLYNRLWFNRRQANK